MHNKAALKGDDVRSGSLLRSTGSGSKQHPSFEDPPLRVDQCSNLRKSSHLLQESMDSQSMKPYVVEVEVES